MLLAGCASVKVTPQRIQPPHAAAAANAIYAEPTAPAQIVVRDFDFSDSSVSENRAPINRTVDVFRSSSADARREEIGRRVAAVLAEQTAKRLKKLGLPAMRVASDNDVSLYGNFLLITGRLIDVDEGNRLTRVAVGLGAGKSRLKTEVHVFRVVNGEKAEVLAFTTRADSGSMPGMLASMGVGELALGPITMFQAVQNVASSGQKIYSSQIDYLAGETSDQVTRYLSQYAAVEGWIPKSKAKSVHLAS
ncbi:MAG TPA: DUF4410 domain-containing protein [Candidatus Acidoferrum sp.]|nr:DUF4410 domain-containing protein [Candidatus Acidoferrum sp.]